MSSFVYRNCDLILTQSRAFDENVRKYTGGKKQAYYFPNWVEPMFEPGVDGQKVAAEVAAFEGAFKVMFAGNVGEAQAIPAIIEAADLCQDVEDLRWLIVGDGRMAAYARTEVARRGLQDRVFLLGRHPVDRMPSFFAGADALLVTLRPEPIWAMTIPGKLQSYLAAGRPVLAMLDGEGRRALEESGAGFAAAAGDAAGLAAAVRRMRKTSAADREAMGSAGRAYARENFNRDRLFDEFEHLVHRLRPTASLKAH
jgi:glycosyltransferase involved in cell wall biosynthesis